MDSALQCIPSTRFLIHALQSKLAQCVLHGHSLTVRSGHNWVIINVLQQVPDRLLASNNKGTKPHSACEASYPIIPLTSGVQVVVDDSVGDDRFSTLGVIANQGESVTDDQKMFDVL